MQETSGQIDLFNTPLADLLNPKHELYQLAHLIDWKVLDETFGEFFTENQGAPALPTRLIAGLHTSNMPLPVPMKRWWRNGWKIPIGNIFVAQSTSNTRCLVTPPR